MRKFARHGWYKLGIVLLLASGAAEAQTGSLPCDEGLAAFKSTLHPFVRAACIACHDFPATGPIQGPPHSVDDAKLSYERLFAFQDFADIPNSYFIQKGGNQHCKTYGVDCKVGFKMLSGVVKRWWEAGQKNCPQRLTAQTKALPLPSNLPDQDHGFTKVRWDLGEIRSDLTGVIFEMEMQSFGGTSYRFRKPRLATGDKAVHVSGMYVLVNSTFPNTANAFASANVTVAPAAFRTEDSILPFPVLSPDLLIIGRSSDQDQIAVGFSTLEVKAGPAECQALPEFQKNVKSTFAIKSCYACHGGPASNPQNAGSAPANIYWSMNKSDQELCRDALARSNTRSFYDSPLIAYPLLPRFEHPKYIDDGDEIAPWAVWLKAEGDVNSRAGLR